MFSTARLRSIAWKATALSLAALVAASAAALAAPPKHRTRSLVLRELELEGSNGYGIRVLAGEGNGLPPTVLMAAKRGPLEVRYEVPVAPGAGLNGVFGDLGRVAMRFERRKRSVTSLEKGCSAITETGVYRGELSFTGEDGYTSVNATSAEGEVVRLPHGLCGFRAARGGLPGGPRLTQVVAGAPTPNGLIRFGALRFDGEKRVEFAAEVRETIGAMIVSRRARAVGTAGFAVGPGKRPHRASVEPPAPFTGSASFARSPVGPPTWTGSLGIALPGAPAFTLAGPEFTARLCPSQSLFAECRAPGEPLPSSSRSVQPALRFTQRFGLNR